MLGIEPMHLTMMGLKELANSGYICNPNWILGKPLLH